MRQVARRLGMERGQEQERARRLRRDQLLRQAAREMKACVDIDGMHLPPGLLADGEDVIGFVPWRRSAVYEMGDAAELRFGMGEQRIACGGLPEIADKGH